MQQLDSETTERVTNRYSGTKNLFCCIFLLPSSSFFFFLFTRHCCVNAFLGCRICSLWGNVTGGIEHCFQYDLYVQFKASVLTKETRAVSSTHCNELRSLEMAQALRARLSACWCCTEFSSVLMLYNMRAIPYEGKNKWQIVGTVKL